MSMRGARPPSLAAMLLVAACSFSSPTSGDDDAPAPDGGGPGGPDGADDRLDADADAIPDGCDDWPCGPKPDDPGEVMADAGSGGRSWGASLIDIGSSRRVVANRNQPFSTLFLWGLRVNCGGTQTSCRAQLEIGYGATRLGCIYDSTITDDQTLLQTHNSPLIAPMTSGVHEIRLNAGQSLACGDSTQPWYGGDPGPESTIAILCVRP